jgi:hypothetical protein
MKALLPCCLALSALWACAAGPSGETRGAGRAEGPDERGVITEAAGAIQRVGEGWWGIVPDFDTGTRYAPDALPADFQVDGLRVIFSGVVGEIPPEVRMWGTPLELTAIRRLEEPGSGR